MPFTLCSEQPAIENKIQGENNFCVYLCVYIVWLLNYSCGGLSTGLDLSLHCDVTLQLLCVSGVCVTREAGEHHHEAALCSQQDRRDAPQDSSCLHHRQLPCSANRAGPASVRLLSLAGGLAVTHLFCVTFLKSVSVSKSLPRPGFCSHCWTGSWADSLEGGGGGMSQSIELNPVACAFLSVGSWPPALHEL